MNMYEDLNRGFEEKYGLTEEILDERTIKGKTKKSDKNRAKMRETKFNEFWNGTDLQCPLVTIKDIKRTPSERVYAWFYANRTKKDKMPGTHQETECYPKYDGHEYPVVIYKKNTDKNGNLIADGSQYSVGQLSKMAKQWLQSFGEGELPEEFPTVYDLIDYDIYAGLNNGNIKAPNKEEQNYFMKYYTDIQQETSGDTTGGTTSGGGGDTTTTTTTTGGGSGEGDPGETGGDTTTGGGDTTTGGGDTTTGGGTKPPKKQRPQTINSSVKINLPKVYNITNLNNLVKDAKAKNPNGDWAELDAGGHKELLNKIATALQNELAKANSTIKKKLDAICKDAGIIAPSVQAASYSKSSNEFYNYVSEDPRLRKIFENFLHHPTELNGRILRDRLKEAKRKHIQKTRLTESRKLREAFSEPLDINKIEYFNMFDKNSNIAITDLDEVHNDATVVNIDWSNRLTTPPSMQPIQWENEADEGDIQKGYFEFEGKKYYLKDFSKMETPWLKKRWRDFYASKNVYAKHIWHGKDLEFYGELKDLYLKNYLPKYEYDEIRHLTTWIEETTGEPVEYFLRFNDHGEVTLSVMEYNEKLNDYIVYQTDKYRARYILAELTDAQVYELYDMCYHN